MMTRTRRLLLLAVAVSLSVVAVAAFVLVTRSDGIPRETDLTESVHVGAVSLRLPRGYEERTGEIEIHLGGSARFRAPRWPSVGISHISRYVMEGSEVFSPCVEPRFEPFPEVPEISGAAEVFFCDLCMWETMCALRPDGAGIAFDFGRAAGVPKDEFWEQVLWILDTVHITDDFDALTEDVQAGPIRLRLPAGVDIVLVEDEEEVFSVPVPDGDVYQLVNRPAGIPVMRVEQGAPRFWDDESPCSVVSDIPGALAAELCWYDGPGVNQTELVLTLQNGDVWTVRGNAVVNEAFVHAVFDTVSVDPDWTP